MSPDIVGTIAAIVIFASFVLRGETQIRFQRVAFGQENSQGGAACSQCGGQS